MCFTMWPHLLGLHIPNLSLVLPQSSDWCVVSAHLCPSLSSRRPFLSPILQCAPARRVYRTGYARARALAVDSWVVFVFVLPWSPDQGVIRIIHVFHLSCLDSSFP